jgi:hypothetical protein
MQIGLLTPMYLHKVSACQNIAPGSTPDLDLVLIRCGFLLTPPKRVANTIYQSLYVCSSTVRATVKEVSFQYKPSAEHALLSDLLVSRVSPKKYSKSTSMPLWAVEKLENKWDLSSIQPLWGITDTISLRNLCNLRTVQSENLYLPACEFGNDNIWSDSWGDSMVSRFSGDMYYIDPLNTGCLKRSGIYSRLRVSYQR